MKYRLVLDIEFDPGNETPFDILEHNLGQIVKEAVNSGALTKETSATIEHYSYSVIRGNDLRK